MSDRTVHMSLTPAEQKLIDALRNLPESRLRERVHRLMEELVTFIQFPRCEAIQADGVPCSTAYNDCDQCVYLDEMLERLIARLNK